MAATRPLGIWQAIKGRCLYLLVSLLALLILYPTVRERGDAALFMFVLHSTILVAGVYAVADRTAKVVAAAMIGIPQIVLTAISVVLPQSHDIVGPINRVSMILLIVYFAYTIVQVGSYVLRGDEVNRDKIYGALSIYLLMGLSWAAAYTYIQVSTPGSFAVAHGSMDSVYFSFVTLTTLGYGDIVPVTSAARMIAALEAVAGVTYMAVAISRLVSVYRPEGAKADKQP
jgi:hypothetical protein